MAGMKVAVLDDYQAVARSCADWERLNADVTFFDRHLGDDEHVAAALADFDVVVAMRERTSFGRELLASLPRLQLLVTTGMRNASIDLDAARDHGVVVCGTRSPGHATAELTFALILMLARGLAGELDSVQAGEWQRSLGRDVRGATLGTIGLGRLGSQVAAFGLAFGMDVVAWSENLTDDAARSAGARRVSRSTLLGTSDFVTIHLRMSARTQGLIGSDELALMRSDAYLVNTSRGEIVDENALLDAVRSGSIAGAAVDVYRQEPLPPDHPYRQEPRILATPHIGYVTAETYAMFYGDAVEDIAAWTAGSPIRPLT
jgi:phosphoglycerate dehydrogenase-like enzyme